VEVAGVAGIGRVSVEASRLSDVGQW
jgi:hypothetical protein